VTDRVLTYLPVTGQNGAGTWDVYVERHDAGRPDPDPWGNGPIVVCNILERIPPDKDYDTGGVCVSYRLSKSRPHVTISAHAKAARIADMLNTGEMTEKRLRELMKGL
jgi:hypothetical protein